jgi:hypothetical protein
VSKTFKGVRAVALACITLVLAASFTVVGVGQTAPAAAAGFDPGNIISDEVFFNSGTMSEAQIQSFLNGKVSKCAAGYSCLKDHSQETLTREADAMCRGYAGAANESAARIIHKVAQSCGVNPQVILVMLQKEQGLVNDSSPSSWAWKASMGYACPDTAACDTRYYGFFNQVYMGVWQLKRYGNPPGTSNYFTWFPIGKAAPIRFSPNASCGSSNVVVKNKATAALYYYTPYQPNAAALAAGYGASNDPCSAYGNRNFYNYFNDWFGTATLPVSPIGNLEVAETTINTATFRGWAFDPETAAAIDIHLYVNGNWGGSFTAASPRQDIAAAYPSYGANHGFDITVPIGFGTFTGCLFAINVGSGANQELGCRTLSTPVGPPAGNFEHATLDGTNAVVGGWVIDPDSPSPIDIHVYVNGAWGGSYKADALREDVALVYPGYGASHGFKASIPLPVGTSDVCVFGINVGGGYNQSLGCSVVSRASGPPIGNVEAAVSDIGMTRMSGWAIDPDTSAPVALHVYVNGAWGGAYTANQTREDVGTAYPGYGNNHGFAIDVPVSGGVNQICVFGINERIGYNNAIGCKTVDTPSGVPFGNVDSVAVSGGTGTISGWAIDPDTVSPVGIHVYVNGAWGGAYTANGARGDVGLIYPKYGANHGFTIPVTLPPGRSEVCSYAINVGSGYNQLVGCRTVSS